MNAIARNGPLPRYLRAAALAAAAVSGVWAQQGEADINEADASTGMAFGATGTNIMVRGALGVSMNRYLVLMIGTTYIPMGNGTLIRYPGIVARSSGVYDFAMDLQFRVPLRSKWVPYAIVAPALIYNHYRRQGVHPDRTTYYFGASDVRGGAEVGGGVRYYFQEYWGFKGEFRQIITSRNFSTLSVGVFRQF